jgi:hypothetical protein
MGQSATAGPADAPPLPAPSGTVVRVETERALQAAVASLAPGTTVLIAPGTYRLTRTLYVRGVRDVAIRGETNDRDAVVLVGQGMTNADYGDVPFGIWAGDDVDTLLIANLTIREFYFHPIIFNAGVRRPRVYNVHLVDAGQQFLKSNPAADGTGNAFGIVEYSVFEFTSTGRDDYPKAIDLHGATGWIIRHNLFRNIRAPEGQLSGPAVLVWRGSRDTIVDGNTFINCQREIVFGAEAVTPNSHEGGVVRNNFIYRTSALRGDAAVSVWDSPGTRVLHNTIVLSGTYPNAIEFRFPDTTGVVIANNLTDAAIVERDGAASAAVSGNVTSATAGMFADAASGNLHLVATAARAIGRGVDLPGAESDWDGEPRPANAPDVGADER